MESASVSDGIEQADIWPRGSRTAIRRSRQTMDEREVEKEKVLFQRIQRAKDETSAGESDWQCSGFGGKQPRVTSGWQRRSQ